MWRVDRLRAFWGQCRTAVVLLLLLGLASACSFFGYISAELSVSVTNDNNHLLAVEGHSNLPDLTPVIVSLREDHDIIVKGNGALKNGAFFVSLDLGNAPGNSALSLEVMLDPSQGPESVKKLTGEHGDLLIGEQVENVGENSVVVDRLRLVLPMNKRQAAIRRVEAGDYKKGIAALEDIMLVEPEEQEVMAWLAYALLSHDSHEDALGSRAYGLLASVDIKKLNEPIRTYCKGWHERWKALRENQKVEQARLKAIRQAKAEREADKNRLIPGVSLGGVKLGMSAKEVYALAIPDKYPAWSNDIVIYHMPDRDVEVHFDGQTSRVIEVHTESNSFALKNNIRVGSTLNAVQNIYSDGRLNMGEYEYLNDGSMVAFGEYTCPDGLIFYVKRMATNDGIWLGDKVKGISVVAPFQWSESDLKELEEAAKLKAAKDGQAMVSEDSYPKAQETKPSVEKSSASEQETQSQTGEQADGSPAGQDVGKAEPASKVGGGSGAGK